jgi:hypothetical protein
MAQGPITTAGAQAFNSTKMSFQRLDPAGGLVSNAVGAKSVPSFAGQLFVGASQAGATLSNGLATTYTGLCLSNPAGGTKNLYVRRVVGAFVVAPAAFIGVGLIQGWLAAGVTVHTTPITPTPKMINNVTVPVGKVDAACTLVGTPSWADWLWGNGATAGTGTFLHDLEGGVIVPPGGYVAVGSLLAAGPTAGFVGSFEWLEF